jgi:N6-L-threonylcarbamoyladenine synthase
MTVIKTNGWSRILAIETSCDDTSVAIVAKTDWRFVVEQIHKVSQDEIHAYFGWVVPELAYRSHATQLLLLFKKIWIDYCALNCDAIAVTAYPWLPWALIIGRACAHFLWLMLHKPVISIHHIMWHVFSPLCDQSLSTIQFPYLCLTVSGWHNDLYLVEDWWQDKSIQWLTSFKKPKLQKNEQIHTKWSHLSIWESMRLGWYSITKLWQTLDDAAWEAFDKVARMLWWPYPGGAWIGEMAEYGKDLIHTEAEWIFRWSHAVLPDYCVSFSWLKSQLVQALDRKPTLKDDIKRVYRVAYLFQERVINTLIKTLDHAVSNIKPVTIGLCGWVAANTRLREMALKRYPSCVFPITNAYCTDNAWMIWVVWLLQ